MERIINREELRSYAAESGLADITDREMEMLISVIEDGIEEMLGILRQLRNPLYGVRD